jgi:hypothetical protein
LEETQGFQQTHALVFDTHQAPLSISAVEINHATIHLFGMSDNLQLLDMCWNVFQRY